jgi:hypothetical protein
LIKSEFIETMLKQAPGGKAVAQRESKRDGKSQMQKRCAAESGQEIAIPKCASGPQHADSDERDVSDEHAHQGERC